MRIVDRPVTRPNHCAVIPFIGQNHRGQWIDTGSELDREHVYVSDVAVFEMARMFGWHPPGDVRRLERDVAGRDERIVDLEAELAQAQRRLEAVDVIESAGFTARKKPGRPPKEAIHA